ncbi:MAG: tetratricopeptide repeat protein, partial [Chloroflexota bacterium]|nr:tetratricopeptide repeat protein [Chloroflexota bacterium]
LATDVPLGTLQAYYGSIEQNDLTVDPKTLMTETLDNPADYYRRLGESYERGRNYDRALEAYQRALQFSPGNSQVIEQMNRVEQHLSGTNP